MTCLNLVIISEKVWIVFLGPIWLGRCNMPWMGKVTADFRWKICGLPKLPKCLFSLHVCFLYVFMFLIW